ncbi:MAG: response regulator transcription factor [Anaerolineae bacterium]|nr:response regulator transcription factor [Anaerolineae bacterium]
MGKPRILVIDDDLQILKLIDFALTRAGFEVLTAPLGDVGLKLFASDKPDLAIVDIALPGIDGYDVIKRMRATDGDLGKIPIIVLSAHEQTVMRAVADNFGVDLYLTKPVKPSQLIDHVRTLVGIPTS